MIRLISLLLSLKAFASLNFGKDLSFEEKNLPGIKKIINSALINDNKVLKEINFLNRKYEVEYTFNDKLEKKIRYLLKRYRSKHTAVTVIDNNTGAVLALVGHHQKNKKFDRALALSNQNPAASIFKVVTAASLLEKTKVEPSSLYSYNGKGSTLYKYQVLKNKKNRWTRTIPLKSAFAYSNNVIFGKAAIKDITSEELVDVSEDLGFNKDLLQFIKSPKSYVESVDSPYELAEQASGFNRETRMSSLHGATIMSIIANDGVYKSPYLVRKIYNKTMDQIIWQPKYKLSRALTSETATQLTDMMKYTVKRGTARSAFTKRKTRRIKDIMIGGKTGTLSGGIPEGRRDWFVSYAAPNGKDKGISISVVIINGKKWYIKAPELTREIIEYYYTRLK